MADEKRVAEVVASLEAEEGAGEVQETETQPAEAAETVEETPEGAPSSAPTPEATDAEPQYVKFSKGEFVPKKEFLKRIKDYGEKLKAAQAQAAEWSSKKDTYADWEKNQTHYQQAMKLNLLLAEKAKTDPYVADLITAIWEGKEIDKARLAEALGLNKPPIDPNDPNAVALSRVEKMERQLLERQQREEAAREQMKFERQYEAELGTAKAKYKDIWSDPMRNAVLDLAAGMSQNAGKPVSVLKAADQLVQMLKAHEANMTKKMQAKAPIRKQAGLERGGGPAGKPAPTKQPEYRSPEWLQKVTDDLVAEAQGL